MTMHSLHFLIFLALSAGVSQLLNPSDGKKKDLDVKVINALSTGTDSSKLDCEIQDGNSSDLIANTTSQDKLLDRTNETKSLETLRELHENDANHMSDCPPLRQAGHQRAVMQNESGLLQNRTESHYKGDVSLNQTEETFLIEASLVFPNDMAVPQPEEPHSHSGHLLDDSQPEPLATTSQCYSRVKYSYPDPDKLPMCTMSNATDEICTDSQWSCHNRCQDKGSADNLSNNPCSCDFKCILYNVCCEDFEEQCQSVHATALEYAGQFLNTRAVCSNIINAMLISECPDDYQDEFVRSRCIKPDPYIVTQLFPVTDSTTGHHFRNEDCWRCWSVLDLNAPLAWTVNITFTLESRYLNEYSALEFINVILESPERAFWQPPTGHNAYYCDGCAVSACTGCGNPTLLHKCSSLHSFVQIKGKTYSNRHCYMCSAAHFSNQPMNLLPKCNLPKLSVTKHEEFAAGTLFRFFITASVANEIMKMEVSKANVPAFSWEKMECTSGTITCKVTKCNSLFSLQKGRCEKTLWSREPSWETIISDYLSCWNSDVNIAHVRFSRDIMSIFRKEYEQQLKLITADFGFQNYFMKISENTFDILIESPTFLGPSIHTKALMQDAVKNAFVAAGALVEVEEPSEFVICFYFLVEFTQVAEVSDCQCHPFTVMPLFYNSKVGHSAPNFAMLNIVLLLQAGLIL